MGPQMQRCQSKLLTCGIVDVAVCSLDEESVESQRMSLLLEALLAIAPLMAECCALRSPSLSLVSHLMVQATAEVQLNSLSCSIIMSHAPHRTSQGECLFYIAKLASRVLASGC